MASATEDNADISILNPEYMALLQRLCVNCKPSVNEVTAIFREFRRSLDARLPKTSNTPSAKAQTSSRSSKKRRGKAVTRGGTLSDEADSSATVLDVVGFERPCTWEPDKRLCWIVSDLQLWNRILSQNCVKLCEHTWGELSLHGYEWPESGPTAKETLRTSLLIHLLLRQHRCITSIYLDLVITTIETYVFWDAIKTGAEGVKVLENRPRYLDLHGQIDSTETTLFCEAIATLKNLTLLRLWRVRFDNYIASKLGGYVEQATALSTLILLHSTAEDADAGVFLDHLARNRSVKRLTVPQALLTARQGHALADVVQNHVTLEELEVNGSPKYSPSVLLRAVVQSCSLQRLTVRNCGVKAEDIEAMASALTQSPKFDAATPPPPPPQLQRLSFFDCARRGFRLERAYADLIGGVLVRLRLFQCGLSDVFATAAASKLRSDRRLRKLQLEVNNFTITGIRNMIGALEKNTSLEVLVLNMTGEHKEEEVSSLFHMIRTTNVFSRLRFYWIDPRASDLSNSVLATKTTSVCLQLDNRGADYAGECLGVVSVNRRLHMLLLACTMPLGQAVVQTLLETCASIRSLRHLMLYLRLHDADVVKLFRALESNHTISVLDLRFITLWRRTAKALGQLLERNHKLVIVTVTVDDKDVDVESTLQISYICRELKEALVGNRFIMEVTIVIGHSKLQNIPDIQHVIGRNTMLINRAIRFVMGSTEKEDALAFETLRHSDSLNVTLKRKWTIPSKRINVMIAEARDRLTFNYFALAGVVKAKVACHRNIKGKKKKKQQRKQTLLDDISRDLQARICSYLSLTDVVDI